MIHTYVVHDALDKRYFELFDSATVRGLEGLAIIQHDHNEVVENGSVTVHHYRKAD